MKILDIELHTTDLDATRLFYVRRLGLPMLSQSTNHLTVLIGWTRLTFRLVHHPVAPYHLAINVPRESLEVVMYYFDLAYLSTQAPGKTIADFTDWRAKACYFYDSTGNLLEFIARTDLSLDDPNLTFTDLFQGVSEVGMASEDVAYTAEQIHRRFGVMQFTKSQPQADFNAIGDDNGLFILSKVGRKWLFSDTSAGLNHCRIQFISKPGGAVQELYSYEVNRLPIGRTTAGFTSTTSSPVGTVTY
ncbi:glyoxalase/bleomycin resistance/dioxygenase family protein [Spirosoma sp. BT702]|uniref:Glyoxalase/bleomycin resistance/dioxygenase family protein n=1 Tax=Spirosoma profusum TaxID=2771354 RepID=A0A926Y1V3_9BACT|nr:glyoxalase/bleomycin resistance/dioxygenase family protein [Spirosoma profusum]MBD2700341.1 glyoxalase/bleomycin resistance/dioxygenase family protein [Spirosoma profusum]